MAETTVEIRMLPDDGVAVAEANTAELEAAAKREDKHSFVALMQAVRWQEHTPAEFLRALDLAFSLGMHTFAAELARRGPVWFPQNRRIQRLASVFAPPRVLGTASARPRLNASLRWLSLHGYNHRGEWVAVHDGKLLAAASTRDKLSAELPTTINRSDVLVTRVLHG